MQNRSGDESLLIYRYVDIDMSFLQLSAHHELCCLICFGNVDNKRTIRLDF